jgi:hypothetical protein
MKDTQPDSNGDAPEASAKCGETTFLYVRAELRRPDPKRIGFFNVMKKIAREAGEPMPGSDPAAFDPDSIRSLDPGSIYFSHVQLVAEDEDEAYLIGFDLLPPLNPDTFLLNDLVIKL